MEELLCRYDSRQSFYGKAKVEEREYKARKSKAISLYSYGILVAMISEFENRKVYHYFGKYSQTTTRHQKEFFKQNGLNDKQIKELFKNRILEVEI